MKNLNEFQFLNFFATNLYNGKVHFTRALPVDSQSPIPMRHPLGANIPSTRGVLYVARGVDRFRFYFSNSIRFVAVKSPACIR